jgi:hypothetical protein
MLTLLQCFVLLWVVSAQPMMVMVDVAPSHDLTQVCVVHGQADKAALASYWLHVVRARTLAKSTSLLSTSLLSTSLLSS